MDKIDLQKKAERVFLTEISDILSILGIMRLSLSLRTIKWRYKDDEIEELMTAYCISVHKSQGSEFPVVIMAITSGSYAILTKNLLYTAVTRAKEMVVLVG